MDNIYQTKIDIVVFSRYQEVGSQFVQQFLDTTKDFINLRLFYVADNHNVIEDSKIVYLNTKEFGSEKANEILQQSLDQHVNYFGWFNDDIWMSKGWLEDILSKFDGTYLFVCPGVVDTDNYEHFLKIVKQTENENSIDEYLPLATWIVDTKIFRKIGLIDTRFKGIGDDMDIYWRLLINKIPHCSSKKVTIGHWVGTSTYRGEKINDDALKSYYIRATKMKQIFCDKHGYDSYHQTAKKMKDTYKVYFKQFRNLKNET